MTVILLGVALLAIALVLAASLGVDQSFEALLPESDPAVQRIRSLEDRLGNQSDLVVSIESPSREANIKFGAALSGALAARDDMRWVEFERDVDFFDDRALLYMDLVDLLDLREEVIHRIRESVRKSVVEDIDSDPSDEGEAGAEEGAFNKARLEEEYGLGDADSERYMEADEGRVIVLKARPRISSSDLEYAARHSDEVDALVATLDPTSFHPEMVIHVRGSYAEHMKRARAMQLAII